MMDKITVKVLASDQQIEAAIARGSAGSEVIPRVTRASFSRVNKRLMMYLSNGVILTIPSGLLQGLSQANLDDLASVEIIGHGTGLHWPKLNVDHSVSGLLAGLFGTRKWMEQVGRQGGRSRSAAKVAAARRNGKRGGRPFRAAREGKSAQ